MIKWSTKHIFQLHCSVGLVLVPHKQQSKTVPSIHAQIKAIMLSCISQTIKLNRSKHPSPEEPVRHPASHFPCQLKATYQSVDIACGSGDGVFFFPPLVWISPEDSRWQLFSWVSTYFQPVRKDALSLYKLINVISQKVWEHLLGSSINLFKPLHAPYKLQSKQFSLMRAITRVTKKVRANRLCHTCILMNESWMISPLTLVHLPYRNMDKILCHSRH